MDFRARIVTWKEIDDWCRTLSGQIIGSRLPDAIIGLSRGGLVPARILSDRLFIKELYSVKTEHWGLTATKDGTATLKQGLSLDISGLDVMLVDDITDTGQSMKLAYDYAKSKNSSSVRTATMIHIQHSDFKPDFFAKEVTGNEWTWFIFPWNVFEDVANLSSKLLETEVKTGELKLRLKEKFDLDVEDQVLKEVIAYMEKLGRVEIQGNGTLKLKK